MFRILVIAQRPEALGELCSGLNRRDYDCSLGEGNAEIAEQLAARNPDLVLVEGGDPTQLKVLSRQIKQDKNLPVIALLDAETVVDVDSLTSIDDFVTKPYRVSELDLRIKRLLPKQRASGTGDQIKIGGLVIDLARCEVTVGSRNVLLTFKEYQLLKFLASNQGRVFSRDALLNKVWGYEYFGGDRTVDVHIKRLRSKIEDASHTFIETVRNIGYRFRAGLS